MKFKYDKNAEAWFVYFGNADQGMINFRNDWEQIFGRWNWLSFTFCEISVEKDNILPGWDFHFVILGLGFHVRYNTDWSQSETAQDILRRAKEISDDHETLD